MVAQLFFLFPLPYIVFPPDHANCHPHNFCPLVSSFLQPFGNHLSVIRFLYPYFFIHFKQCTLSQLIRLFIVVIACMGCYFTKRNLYFLSCFLHMGCVFAGQWCFCSPYTCYPFLYPFIIIADFHSRILVF